MINGELIVDNFAGGGGASTGIEMATGMSVDIAINHDIEAIRMHKANHPSTKHYCESVWDINPIEVCKGNPVALAWFSPDCKHFSKAKGGKPKDKKCPSIFDTAEEIKEKYGIRAVRPLAPKTMERIARGLKKFVLDNQEPFIVPIGYGEREGQAPRIHDIKNPLPTIVSSGKHYLCEPYMIQIGQTGFAADRSKDVREPLTTIVSKNEHCLIATKMAPYMGVNTTNHPGGNCKEPIHTITTGNQQCLISPTLIQYHSETSDSDVRGQTIEKPIMTVDSSNRYGLVTSFLSKFYKSGTGQDVREPLHTITTSAGHFGEVRAFLIKYYGECTGQDIKNPLDTVTPHDRFGLVTIEGVEYQIMDIGLRMLEPKELYGCQGFPEDYIIDHDYTGKAYSRTEQVKRCGNAVCPPIPAAMVRANLPELCVVERMPNMSIESQLRFA